MSLHPDDHHRRTRSKSPGRSRSRSRSRSDSHSHDPSRQHYQPDPQYQYQYASPADPRSPFPADGSRVTMGGYTDLPPDQRPAYLQQQQQQRASPAPSHSLSYSYTPQPQGPQIQQQRPNITYTAQPHTQAQQQQQQQHHNLTYTAQPHTAAHPGYGYASQPDKLTYTSKPVVSTAPAPASVRHTATPVSPSQPQPQYTAIPQPPTVHPPQPPTVHPPQPPPINTNHSYPPPPMGAQSPHSPHPHSPNPHSPRPDHHRTPSYPPERRVVEVVPGGSSNAPPSPGGRPHSLSVNTRPEGLTTRMDRLSVSGNRPDLQTIVPGSFQGGLPPPSPLLEPYHGTYQSLSPMPQAMMLDDDLDHIPGLDLLSPRGSNLSVHGHRRAHSSSGRSPSPAAPRHRDRLAIEAYGNGRERSRSRARSRSRVRDREDRKEEKRRARIYDAEVDALALCDALTARTPKPDPLIDILPALTHDQMLELRAEYKHHCKVQGRGINVAKHIKLKISGNFGKIAYVTALGRYESEGYWANFWYQSHSARRELLIEALMGRSNFDMREIRAAFRDKRYSDSLTRCMDKELKADKFRKAVLMALEAQRQEESDVWPAEYRAHDAETLHRALTARDGGESAMLGIVVMRSDAHLRDVLRIYERTYRGSFARDALRKSNNLVGEVITHILNGVMNRPARDAMLLHHALLDLIDPLTPAPSNSSSTHAAASKHERQQRYELLISRLVRLHWERLHLERVKGEYETKYGRLLEEDIEEATKGDFREFCLSICQSGR